LRDAVSAARPRLITQRRHLTAILAAGTCIVFCLLFLGLMYWDVPHASAWGENLNLAALAANEQVVVRHVTGGRGESLVFEFRIGGKGDPRGIVVARQLEPWADESVLEVLAMAELTDRQATGLESMVEYFRARREERTLHLDLYRLEYFRDGIKIGEEHFVGFSLASDLTYLRRFGPRGDWDSEYELGRLARQYHVPREELDRMVTFDLIREQLTKASSGAAP